MKRLNEEILALYREARSGSDRDFKTWAIRRAMDMLPMHSACWIHGVLTDERPILHEQCCIGIDAGCWEEYVSLIAEGIDPLGPMMCAHPGRSVLAMPSDFPKVIVERIHLRYGVRTTISGMTVDRSTGTFSIVCWIRAPSMPDFDESDRSLHEQLLPHWMEGLNLHRVGRVVRALQLQESTQRTFALVDARGAIHHAQPGFGELMVEEFPQWHGSVLPPGLLDVLDGAQPAFDGRALRATIRQANDGLLVLSLKRHDGPSLELARDSRASLLSASLQASERELESTAAALQSELRKQAAAEERQRIMRDLHDGLGAHLVGMLNLVHAREIDASLLEDSVRQALDEMRLMVDALQGDDVDLVTALASLRYRMRPRFAAAGVMLDWPMHDDAEPFPVMAPNVVFQILRILLEACTNVLKHAHASQVQVSVNQVPRGIVEVCVTDDGVGLPAGASGEPGHGLRNMQHRARSIDAELSIDAGLLVGTRVCLRWPATPAHERAPDDAVKTRNPS